MVIQKIHKLRDKLPDTLPHAHLYLEDVQEIANILLEATADVLSRFREEAKVTLGRTKQKMETVFRKETRAGK